MKTYFYSDITHKYYETQEDCLAAEEAVKKAEEEKKAKESKRAERAKEVEQAFEEARAADKRAQNLLKEFCKDYGSFHTTLKEPFDTIFQSFWNLI